MSVTDFSRKIYHGKPEIHRGQVPLAVALIANPALAANPAAPPTIPTLAQILTNSIPICIGNNNPLATGGDVTAAMLVLAGYPVGVIPVLATGVALPQSVSMSIQIENLSETANENLYVAFPTAGEQPQWDALAQAMLGEFKTIGPGNVYTIDCAVLYFLLWSNAANVGYEISIIHEETQRITL